MLDAKNVTVKEERLSRKQPLQEAEAQALLASVDEVWVLKGKTVRTLASKDTSLDDLRGPTGNFRAPMLRRDRKLLVGFQAETLESFVE